MGIRIIKAGEWRAYAASLPPASSLLEPLIPLGGKTLLHGPPGSGKSALMWGIGNAIACGTPYLGLASQKARVLLLSLDMTARELKDRWHDSFDPLFDIICVPGFNCTKPGFSHTELYAVIKDYVEQEDIQLIMIDALGGIHSGRSAREDEVADDVDRVLTEWLPDRTILLVSHNRKKGMNPGGEPVPADDEDFLGSQKWRANATSQIHMWPIGDHVSKLKHAKSQVSLKLEEPLRVYIDMHGRAELYSQRRAKEVGTKYLTTVQELGIQHLSVSEQVEAIAKHLGKSKITIWRWKQLLANRDKTDDSEGK